MLKVLISKAYSKTNDFIKTTGVPILIVYASGVIVMIAQFIWFAFTSGVLEDFKKLLQ